MRVAVVGRCKSSLGCDCGSADLGGEESGSGYENRAGYGGVGGNRIRDDGNFSGARNPIETSGRYSGQQSIVAGCAKGHPSRARGIQAISSPPPKVESRTGKEPKPDLRQRFSAKEPGFQRFPRRTSKLQKGRATGNGIEFFDGERARTAPTGENQAARKAAFQHDQITSRTTATSFAGFRQRTRPRADALADRLECAIEKSLPSIHRRRRNTIVVADTACACTGCAAGFRHPHACAKTSYAAHGSGT